MAKDDELTRGESIFCYALVIFIVVVGISQIIAVFQRVALTNRTFENMDTMQRIRDAAAGDSSKPIYYTPGKFTR